MTDLNWEAHKLAVKDHELLMYLASVDSTTVLKYDAETVKLLPEEDAHPDVELAAQWKTKAVHYQPWLYPLTRLAKPRVAAESGIGFPPPAMMPGLSTKYITAAMAKNAAEGYRGTLTSADVAYRNSDHMLKTLQRTVLMTSDEQRVWNPQAEPITTALVRTIKEDGYLDLYLHDGDHSWHSETFELELAYRYLRPGGYLVSDDWTWGLPPHGAWPEFISRWKVPWGTLGAAAVLRKPWDAKVAVLGDLRLHTDEILRMVTSDPRFMSGALVTLEESLALGGGPSKPEGATAPEGAA